ncbi:hypothetical protein FOCC_FOCC013087, partial [Frankliniella occidentalis]
VKCVTGQKKCASDPSLPFARVRGGYFVKLWKQLFKKILLRSLPFKMSMYDNIRALQYVDFLNLQNNDADTDASAFFNSALEMDSSLKLRSSEKSQLSSFSDSERTLTPTAFNHTFEGVNSSTLTPKIAIENNTSSQKRTSKINNCESPRSALTPTRSALNKSKGEKLDLGTKKVNWELGQDNKKETKSIADSQSGEIREEQFAFNVIPPTPTALGPALDTSTPLVQNGTVPKRDESGKSASSKQKRRSRSAGPAPASSPKTEEEMLLQALDMLKLNSGRKSISANLNQSISPQVFSNDHGTSSKTLRENQRIQDETRCKRKLSPGSKHIRDSTQQPEKFISMAEEIARIQKNTPTRFRTVPKSASLKGSIQSKLVKNIRLQPKRPVPQNSRVPSEANSPDLQGPRKKAVQKGVRVARWEAPKVEPYKFTEQSKELPKKMFNFDKKEHLLLRDRRTPLKRIIPTTKVEPFSFDKRDQEIIKRKVERLKGVAAAPNIQCTKPATRQRSKSHNGVISAGAGEQVRHARVPVVLYKAPFQPHLPPHKPTRPLPVMLSTERRAKEREEFEEHLRKKEEQRSAALHQLQERRRLEEEREIQQLRKDLVHKAHPMPAYHKFKVKPSNAPLTSPHSPAFSHRIVHVTRDGSNDEPMDC